MSCQFPYLYHSAPEKIRSQPHYCLVCVGDHTKTRAMDGPGRLTLESNGTGRPRPTGFLSILSCDERPKRGRNTTWPTATHSLRPVASPSPISNSVFSPAFSVYAALASSPS